MSVGTSDESHIAVSLCPSVGRAKAVPPWRAVPCWRELQAYPTVTLPCAPPVSIYFWSSLHGYPAQRNRSVNINSIGRVRHSSFHNTVNLYAPVNPPLLSPAGQRRRGWPKGQRGRGNIPSGVSHRSTKVHSISGGRLAAIRKGHALLSTMFVYNVCRMARRGLSSESCPWSLGRAFLLLSIYLSMLA